MASILIDGYNVTGIAHESLEKARNELLHHLRNYALLRKHDITVVFDGWKSGHAEQSRVRTGHITVIYSRLGDTADRVIRTILSTATKPWIVVSSDREISDFAEKRDFAAVTSDEFEEKLFRALNEEKADSIPDLQESAVQRLTRDSEEYEHPRVRSRGNPMKLSKKQRRRIQALRKL